MGYQTSVENESPRVEEHPPERTAAAAASGNMYAEAFGLMLAQAQVPQARDRDTAQVTQVRDRDTAQVPQARERDTAIDVGRAISDLNSDNYRTRAQASNDLALSGVRALPAVMGALDQRPSDMSLEQRRRLESHVRDMSGNRIGEVLDGMAHRDASVRQASAALVGRVQSGDLLTTVGRGDLNQAQQDRVREVLLNRNTASELEQLYRPGFSKYQKYEPELRAGLGYARLFDQARVPEAETRLGAALASDNANRPDAAQRLDEAAGLLQRGAASNDLNVRIDALTGLASVRAQQGNAQQFLDATRRLMPAIAQMEANEPKTAREALQRAGQAAEAMLRNRNLSEADHQRVTQYANELARETQAFTRRNPDLDNGKKSN